MSKLLFRYLVSCIILIGLYACSATKHVPDGEYLLDKVAIHSDVPGNKALELKPYIKQQPNFKMFNLNKTMFQIYNLSGKDSTRWINRFLRNVGEPPVIFNNELVKKTDNELKKLLINKGYLNAEVSSNIQYKGKKAEVTYNIKGNTPYKINEFSYDIQEPQIEKELYGSLNGQPVQTIRGESTSLRTSYIKPSMLFDRNILDAERDRISTLLKNRGYFGFDKNSIRYEADTSLSAHAVNLEMIINQKNQKTSDNEIIQTPYKKYNYDKVEVYLDYDPLKYVSVGEYKKKDSLIYNNYTIFYQGKKPSLRPSLVTNNCFIVPGRTYSQLRENLTYTSLASLNALNNVHIQYYEKTEGDSALLDCTILTIPSKKQTVSFSIEGTNTSGDLGIASSVTYSHKNLFRGAETFNLRLRGAYEAISSFNDSYLELGGETSISVPKFLFPFIHNRFSQRMRTLTEFSLSYNTQRRPEYHRNLFSGGLHYIWQNRTHTNIRHQYNLLDIDYIYLPYIDPDFKTSLPANAELFGYKNHFIVGMSYSYYNSTFDPLQKQRSARSIRFSVESAGNVLYGLSNLSNEKKDSNGSYQLFGNHYSQFVKADFDYSRTVVFDKQNSLAFRIGAGVGFPYGNSTILPFEKRYYSGGANSVRAWSVRELGPGRYIPTGSSNLLNRTGDIKFDMNLEYRTRLFWKFETAVFVDAGNIWTIKDYEGQEGGKFKVDSFYKEIALGYGIGLRLDFDFFLIRLDCGWKAYNPEKLDKKKENPWTILHPNFNENFAWHIAIGYPF